LASNHPNAPDRGASAGGSSQIRSFARWGQTRTSTRPSGKQLERHGAMLAASPVVRSFDLLEHTAISTTPVPQTLAVTKLTRRDCILGTLGVASWSAIASAQQHAHKAAAVPSSTAFEHFDPATARDIGAIAAQIVPSDDGPGATEAGAVYFIDRALKTFAADQQSAYREGLADLKLRREKLWPGSPSFAELTAAEQAQLLRSIEATDFFSLLRLHTVLAWLGSPEYGGNRDSVGWKYIGFDDRGYFAPPFGYYDAQLK
jgi:gluconate 2-dehydrogenase gamma chain